jgi:hypothetical protein
MSTTHQQLTYKCECLIDPWGGTCGQQSRFIMRSNNTGGTQAIYHRGHIDDPNTKYELWKSGQYVQDEEIKALTALLNLPFEDGPEPIDPKFWDDLKTLT